ncbi:MAG: PDZ domain-containing protein [Nocardioides marinisabuli]|uniref:YlbL family protein n=2 Tax=Nocardioides TaxID=1839 RepID=UPI003219B551
MSQRLIAALLAAPLVLALFVAAWFTSLPYATYQPGPTVDVLDQPDGSETIQVRGVKTYRDAGELRLTTVSVSPVGKRLSLPELMWAWFDGDEAVLPYDYVHPDDVTPEEDERQGAVSMVTSQDVAIANALRELDYDVEAALQVAYVVPDSPADGALEVRDVVLRVDDEPVDSAQMLVEAIQDTPEGESVTLQVERDGKKRDVDLTPEKDPEDGVQRVGFTPGQGFRYPFDVTVNIDPNIGGPSAGLMFALGIYDTLTEGSLTGGGTVAGTGTLDLEGTVGPIGGIQQKIAGAERDGAELFLVPAEDCAEALGVDDGEPRLVRAETFESALAAVQAWADDPDADLPSCED